MIDPKYKDIFQMEHHTSSTHPRMSMESRAAQFSPFAALTGYEDVIDETARVTDEKSFLLEDARRDLDETFQALAEDIASRPEVTVTYFRKDRRKKGGEYVTVTGHLKKIDEYSRTMILEDGTVIPMDDVFSLSNTL